LGYNGNVLPIVLALCAGLANALATVLQRLGVEATPGGTASSGRLIASVLKRPVWFAGLVCMIASFLLQALALSAGTLSTVQPVMVTELVFLLAILGIWFHRALGWREWVGACGTAIGLGIFLAASTPTGGGLKPDIGDWGLVLGCSAAGLVLALACAHRGRRSWRAAWYGVAGGIAFALTAAFIKVTTDYAQSQGLARIFLHWQPYAIAAAGLIGLVVTQHALQAGPIAASQSALLIVNPMASILMGILLFGDHLQTTRGRAAADALALGVMFVGLIVLSHSPLIASSAEDEQLSRRPGAAGPGRPAGSGMEVAEG
jgi:drug/metabolite transporter (DMT)-like permease